VKVNNKNGQSKQIEIAARNKANYLKAKEAFNNKRVDECLLFYAPDHEVKSKQSEKGRGGSKRFWKVCTKPRYAIRSYALHGKSSTVNQFSRLAHYSHTK